MRAKRAVSRAGARLERNGVRKGLALTGCDQKSNKGPDLPLTQFILNTLTARTGGCTIVVPTDSESETKGAFKRGQNLTFKIQGFTPEHIEDSGFTAGIVGQVGDLAANGSHTCALLDTGKVRCWGNDYQGRLGYGHTQNIGDNETPASAGDVHL